MIKRSNKPAFYGVSDKDGNVTYKRMVGFTKLSVSKNPKNYTRQYIDEDFEHSDIVGYQTSVNYEFDRFEENDVHNDIIAITDNEIVGNDAVRSIVIVDLTDNTAIERSFSVIPDTEGDSTDAYTYSGSFKANGTIAKGTVTSEDGYKTVVFTKG